MLAEGKGTTCKTVCAGKKGNLLFEQCRNPDGTIASMRRIGECEKQPTSVGIPENGVIDGKDDIELVEED